MVRLDYKEEAIPAGSTRKNYMKLDDIIIFEDKNLLVINKPAGLVVHGDGRTKEQTLADLILEKYPKMKNVGEPVLYKKLNIKNEKLEDHIESETELIPRPGIVHRLDRDTSGVLLIAKTEKMFEHLKKQFQDHQVKKTYHAFVYGWPTKDEGEIIASIARSRKDFRLWSAQRGKKGKERDAITLYKVLKRFGDDESEEPTIDHRFSFLELSPQTGRTHQIRVHLKYLNHPVVADTLYAPRRPQALGFKRQALHAFRIEFRLPKGKTAVFEAPYPEDFSSAVKRFS
jgi:23S rRNA pseudouridine1911/1915/1917 synthase